MRRFSTSLQVIIQLIWLTHLINGFSQFRFKRQMSNGNNPNMMMPQIPMNPQMANINSMNQPGSQYQQNLQMSNVNNRNGAMPPQAQLQQNQPRSSENNVNMMMNQFQQNSPMQNGQNSGMPMNMPVNQPINRNSQPVHYNNPSMQGNSQPNGNKNQQIDQNSQRSLMNNQQINSNPIMNNGPLPPPPPSSANIPSNVQMNPTRNQDSYQNQFFQQSPFSGAKPNGWFGTNRDNWVSIYDSELDKNKLAGNKDEHNNNFMGNSLQTQRTDGGPMFLADVAKQYASQGRNGFNIGPHETVQGRGSVCTNFENFGGFTYGRFPCPLPASTGMNQMDVFCCGPTNYQYCCNIQEYRESQRGSFGENPYLNDQRYPKLSTYPSSTKKILAIVLPIVSILILGGVGVLVFLYYKKFRQAQYRVGKPTGATRLDENYTALAQDQFND